MSSCELVIIRGLPGSRKSTYAKDNYPGHLHYEPDHLFCDSRGEYRYNHQLWDKACEWIYLLTDYALARGENVVISDVFLKSTDIDPYRELVEQHGASLRIITTYGSYKNVHRVPYTVQQRMKDEFEYIPSDDTQCSDCITNINCGPIAHCRHN